MKKYFFLAVFGLGVVTMSSCNKQECCTWNGAKVCEDDLPPNYTSWDDYKDAAEAGGANCD